MIRLAFSIVGIAVGTELVVGLLDMLGDIVIVGELLGSNDGATDGAIVGELDVDGDDEGLIEGSGEGWLDGLMLG